MCQGVVSWFSQSKGYGFIIPDGSNEEIFLHHSRIEENVKDIKKGTIVSFDTVPGERGQKAESVRVVA